ncbi:MAG: histidinol-phosphatase [Bacteroidales bacterium]|nr:histidinol-phosphatase [Bacteroidales bacterium]MCF8344153.1 histidinol-phosphatase [Bacteroidales bacterium]MCF8349990.1 histidinol-phosphatase [Bacteroidales bacterium]MCF8376732.1 histidinol-phosphatase [Bacteroidales bacterium]
MKLFNLHTHTTYSDGKQEPVEYIREALRQEFDVLGFSEHSPVPLPNDFALQDNLLPDYIDEIQKLKKDFKNRIEIYTGLETDFIPGLTTDFQIYQKQYQLDFIIGSVHLIRNGTDKHLWFIDGPKFETYDQGIREVFGGNAKKAVRAYFNQLNQMIESQRFDIIGHMDKIKMHNRNRYFTEDEQWYTSLIDESLELIKQHNIIVEVNTRGIYKKRSDSLFPGAAVLKKIRAMNIPVTISSDAHHPDDLSKYFPETIGMLKDIGLKEVVCLNGGEWKNRVIGDR